MVEFAVVLPMLMFLLLGIVDVSRYAYCGLLASNAARAAAQYGAQNMITADDITGMQNAAYNDAQGLSGLRATATPICKVNGVVSPCSSANAVAYVQVVTTGLYQPLVSYPGIPSSVTVTANATIRVEKQ